MKIFGMELVVSDATAPNVVSVCRDEGFTVHENFWRAVHTFTELARIELREGASVMTQPDIVHRGIMPDGTHFALRGHELIRAANATLDDDDPRKITREWVEALREFIVFDAEYKHGETRGTRALRAIADALESYLPPEGV